jgi:hypothetical protein
MHIAHKILAEAKRLLMKKDDLFPKHLVDKYITKASPDPGNIKNYKYELSEILALRKACMQREKNIIFRIPKLGLFHRPLSLYRKIRYTFFSY